jgi:hypothetical protein
MERDRTGDRSPPSWLVRDSAGGARHIAAVARSLAWADEAAERGDHVDALSWLRTLEAAGENLSPDYAAKRERWQRAAADQRAGAAERPCATGG